jgi:sulfur carrier protein
VIITVNGEVRDVPSGATVATVVELLEAAPDGRGIAVALNGEVVSRRRWPETKLLEGSWVEVVSAIQGG